ncbi:MAG: hypothetical protein K1X57_21610 [Gemmataceae bacterium]|nr:hypothetical protein [Gemmataceae bacterium]
MTWRSLLIALMVPATIRADDLRESHAPVTPSAGDVSNNEILARQLANAKAPGLFQRLFRDPNLLEPRLRELIARDPAAADIVRRLMDGDPQLLRLAEQIASRQPGFRELKYEQLRERLPDLARQYLQNVPPATPPRTPSEAERARNERQAYAERIDDLLRDYKLEGLAGDLRDMPIYNNWLKELTQAASAGPGPLTLGDVTSAYSTAEELFRELKLYLPDNLPSLPKFNFSAPNIPLIDLSSLNLSAPNVQSFAWSDRWTTFVWWLAGIIAVVAIWRMKRGRTPDTISVARRGLGPWPVDPAQINSRAELIAAFEYLAQWKCGPEAACWNHRAVAARFDDDLNARQLADLYELARYAPSADGPWESARGMIARLTLSRGSTP